MKIRQLAARVGFESDRQLASFFNVTIDEIRAWNVGEVPTYITSTLEEMAKKNIKAEDVSSPLAVGGSHIN